MYASTPKKQTKPWSMYGAAGVPGGHRSDAFRGAYDAGYYMGHKVESEARTSNDAPFRNTLKTGDTATCRFSAKQTIRTVYYNNQDITPDGKMSDPTSMKTVTFDLVIGATLAVSALEASSNSKDGRCDPRFFFHDMFNKRTEACNDGHFLSVLEWHENR